MYTSRIERLPNDMIEIIYYKLYKLHYKDVIIEMESNILDTEWHDLHDLPSDDDLDIDYETESDYSSDSD